MERLLRRVGQDAPGKVSRAGRIGFQIPRFSSAVTLCNIILEDFVNRKLVRTLASFSFALTVTTGSAQESQNGTSNAGLGLVKSLAGNWEGTTPDGKPLHVSYSPVSNGSAVLERRLAGGEAEMVTLYSANGNRVVVTHYCSAGNQPQMQTAPLSSSPKKLSFVFVSATNLASQAAGHMVGLGLTFVDKDHLIQEWTWSEAGKASTEVDHLTRKS